MIEPEVNCTCESIHPKFCPVHKEQWREAYTTMQDEPVSPGEIFYVPLGTGETRHGSPTFYALLDEMASIHSKKSHDYASNDNPYGNYHFAGMVANLFSHSSQDAGFVGRIAEKLYRLANLENSGKTPLNESVEDTERDIATIVALWIADRRDRRGMR